MLILPPLIWGWLTYRVMAFDCLALHASADERRQLMQEHRFQLLSIGLVSGYLGALPSVLWASGAMFIAMAPVLVPLAIWVYTLVFAFSSLWFAHYCLAMLEKLRARPVVMATAPDAASQPLPSQGQPAPAASEPVSPPPAP